ncbi:FAD dependent oxidoreductase-domain-containing protein [Chytriomyces sp. MP71]|nr:FAD dependent oxidoreductase-domain-containing protein [Chytriomyces sp. MP71]
MGRKLPQLAKQPLQSHWLQDLPTSDLPPPPPVQREFDVIIVGGGISGFSTALHLSRLQRVTKNRLNIAVLEARDVAGGATGRNGGLLRPGVEAPFAELCSKHGRAEALRLFHFERQNAAAILQFLTERGAEERVGLHRFKVGGVKGLSPSDDPARLRREAEEWEREGCNTETFFISEARVGDITGHKSGPAVAHGAAVFPEYRINAAQLTLEIALAAASEGNVSFFKNCLVDTVHRSQEGGRVFFRLTTSLGEFFSASVVYATNAWTSALLPHVSITPVRNQVICTAPSTNTFWKEGEFAMILNGGGEYMSGRGDGRIVLGGLRSLAPEMDVGCDRDDAVNEQVSKALHEYLPLQFNGFESIDFSVEREWSGVMGWTRDKSPLVGSLAGLGVCIDKEFICAGFCGHGMTRCFLSGCAVAAMVLGLPMLDNFPRSFLPTLGRVAAVSNEFDFKVDIAAESLDSASTKGRKEELAPTLSQPASSQAFHTLPFFLAVILICWWLFFSIEPFLEIGLAGSLAIR